MSFTWCNNVLLQRREAERKRERERGSTGQKDGLALRFRLQVHALDSIKCFFLLDRLVLLSHRKKEK